MDDKERLEPIEGTAIDLLNLPKGCAFSPRCKNTMKICLERYPDEEFVDGVHRCSCFMYIKEELDKEMASEVKTEEIETKVETETKVEVEAKVEAEVEAKEATNEAKEEIVEEKSNKEDSNDGE